MFNWIIPKIWPVTKDDKITWKHFEDIRMYCAFETGRINRSKWKSKILYWLLLVVLCDIATVSNIWVIKHTWN